MALSEREQKVLEDLEQQLSTEDPQLASQMDRAGEKTRFSTRNIVVGVLIAAVGLGVLLAGVAVERTLVGVIVGVVGFLAMAGGVFFATMGKSGPDKKTGGKTNQGSSNSSSFMNNLEDKWEQRRREQR